jgi:hypothetical protein
MYSSHQHGNNFKEIILGKGFLSNIFFFTAVEKMSKRGAMLYILLLVFFFPSLLVFDPSWIFRL